MGRVDPVEHPTTTATSSRPGGTRRTAKAAAGRWQLVWLRRGFALLVFLAALEYLVLPQIAGTRTALRLLGQVQPGWLTVGFVLEALSLASYSCSHAASCPTRVRRPGGPVTASPLRYRLLTDGGTSSGDAIVGATVEGIGSAFVLLTTFWLALILSIPFTGVLRRSQASTRRGGRR